MRGCRWVFGQCLHGFYFVVFGCLCAWLALQIMAITLGSRNKALRFIDNQRLLQWGSEALEALAIAEAV